ncbi:hypothetical protein LUZ60_013925 [Juncus effusus]|nr:hypothetical protein LUZ60_013925 [Juncus effusus]
MDSSSQTLPPPLHDEEDETPQDLPSQLHSLPVATLSLSISASVSTANPPSKPLPTKTHFSKFPTKLPLSFSLSPFTNNKPTLKKDKSASNSPLHTLSPFINIPPANPSSGFAGRRCTVVWLRSDLRIHDNEALSVASSESLSMLPVFLLDPRDFGKSPSSGFDRTGPYRAQFLLDSVKDLRNSLRNRGSDLIVRIGRPETVLPELAKEVGADGVFAHHEVSRDEVKTEEKVQKALEKQGIEIKYFWGSTLYHLEDLPFELDQMPTNYGGFRERVSAITVRKVITAPDQFKGVPARGGVEPGEIPTLAELGVSGPPAVTQDGKKGFNSSLVGGETEAIERLRKFASECGAHVNKLNNNNNKDSIYGANFSCKISPWLATGCLSPRFMFEELKKNTSKAIGGAKKGDAESDGGMNWLMFELLWRDFFRFITKKYSSVKKSIEEPVTACTGALA